MKYNVLIGFQLIFFKLIEFLINIISVQAQVIPDMILHDEQSLISPDNLIEGGARRGKNLFHSFQEFNIQEGEFVHFANPQGVETILSRVTGGAPSYLYGTLGVDGSASLYFINPTGIFFGPNSNLDISGSFIASTANAFTLGDNITFSAVNPQAVPLLRVNVPIGIHFGDVPAGNIHNLGTLFAGQDLTLSAGNIVNDRGFIKGRNVTLEAQDTIFVDGGIVAVSQNQPEQLGDIKIEAANLHIIDGGILDTSTKTSATGGNIVLNISESIYLTESRSFEEFRVEPTGLFASTFTEANGGDISINTSELFIKGGAQLVVDSNPEMLGVVGKLSINASQLIEIQDDFSSIVTQGRPGNIEINTRNLRLKDGGAIVSIIFESAQSGDLIINASGSVQILETRNKVSQNKLNETSQTEIANITIGSGQAGKLIINTNQLLIDGELQFSLQEEGGRVVEETLEMPLESRIITTTIGSGNAGEIIVNSSKFVTLRNRGTLSADTQSNGDAGDITVESPLLTIQDGAQITTNTIGSGSGGNITILSSNIKLIETQENIISPAGILASSIGSGDAGEVVVSANNLRLLGGAQITSSVLNQMMISLSELGNQGTIEIDASESVSIVGQTSRAGDPGDPIQSGVFTVTEGEGSAENLSINTPLLNIEDGGTISAENRGIGSGGTLSIKSDSLLLERQASIVSTTNSQIGGDINLNVSGTLLLRNNSKITTNAEEQLGSGNGGNIFIDAGVVIAFPNENSDITTEASLGNGGLIEISTQGLFGFAIDNQSTLLSGISANSEFGTDGQVEINSFNNLAAGLVALPEALVAPGPQHHCPITENDGQRRFVTTLSKTPLDPQEISSHNVWEDLRPTASHRAEPEQHLGISVGIVENSSPPPLIEAQGWQRVSNGNYLLTVKASNTEFSTKRPYKEVCRQL